MITRPPKILKIRSDISELKKVESFLMDIFKEFNLTQKCFNKTYLCISEAVVNSIKHGNKNDRKKTVVIGLDCFVQEIMVLIEDEGEGFDITKIEDPLSKENIKKESGRGIHIIKTLTDKIEYNDKGNCIQFKIECK